jgi:RNA polymerase sigma-70 factor (ECF subfamily)
MVGIATVFSRARIIETDPDLAAVARCRAGDADAFAEIVDRYQGMVAGLVARSLRNPDDAADVTQEVFVRAYRGLRSFRSDAKFSTWLYRIALNTAIRHAGKAARESSHRAEADPEHPDSIAALPADPDEAPDHLVWQRIRHEALRDAVHQLPDKHREVIVLHFFEGKTCEEIAEILETNIGTVWSRVHYAVKKLRAQLEGIASG